MEKKRKTLGILGGMGPMATQLLYQNITAHTYAQCDQDHLNILIYSHATLPDRTTAIHSGNTSEILEKLCRDVAFLEKSGAEYLAIPCNTSHYFWREMSQKVEIPILNMVELTAKAVHEKQGKKVAILATEGTQKTRLYQNALEKYEISTIETPCRIQDKVNEIIYQQIKKGQTGSYDTFQEIHDFFQGQEVDFSILACTELSVFRQNHPLPPSYIDALNTLTEACIREGGGKFLEQTQEGSVL